MPERLTDQSRLGAGGEPIDSADSTPQYPRRSELASNREALLNSVNGKATGDGPEPDELFLFVHLPKTGGQSLRHFFMKHLAFHREFIHLGPYGLKDAQDRGLLPYEQRPEAERALARVILGHYVHKDTHKLVPGRIPRHITFVREPAEMLLSYYNFQMSLERSSNRPAVGFDQWYDSTKRGNLMTRWFYKQFMRERDPGQLTRRILEEVVEALREFWFVGCTEHLDRDAPVLFKRMGIEGSLERANVAGVHFEKLITLDPSLRRRLQQDNPLDVELYEYWKNRLDESVAGIKEDTAHPRSGR
jgi:Sulfotransferase family